MSRSKNYFLQTLKNSKTITIVQIACFCKFLDKLALYNVSNKTYESLIRNSKDFNNFKDFTIEDIIHDVKHGVVPYKRYCEACGKQLHVKSIKSGYIKTCGSQECYHDHWIKANKEAIFKKYGVYNIQQIDSVKEKTKETCLLKYGVTNGGGTPEAQEKIRKTMRDRYGVEHALQHEAFKEKFKNTCYLKFGTSCPFNNAEILNKIEKSKLEKNLSPFNSNLEIEIYNYIKSLYDKEIIINDWAILNGQQLDIVIPDLKIAFEINGIYWHQANEKNINYHLNKSINSISNEYVLFHIFEDDWKINKVLMKEKIYNVLNEIYDAPEYIDDNKIVLDLKWPNIKITEDYKIISIISPELKTYEGLNYYDCGKVILQKEL